MLGLILIPLPLVVKFEEFSDYVMYCFYCKFDPQMKFEVDIKNV